MTRWYTGVGSRDTPVPILELMAKIGLALAVEGYTLRSGGADGADTAFEYGAMSGGNRGDIYLPWRRFNDNPSMAYGIQNAAATKIAARIHPAWFACSRGARALHTRNVYQVLSYDLKTPSDFLVCWTKDGKDVGGTRTAIVLAREWSIPVWNLANERERELIESWFNEDVPQHGTLGDLLSTPLEEYWPDP